MNWDRIKRILIPPDNRPVSEIAWVKAADNPWGVDVLDVRPVTLNTLVASESQQCAVNAVSFVRDDGTSFIGERPPNGRTVPCRLRFPIVRELADGPLFTPLEMEHKWALFHHGHHIICVRSWQRQVEMVATVEPHQDYVDITSIAGTFGEYEENPVFTIRMFDGLMRTHALNVSHPLPLPRGLERYPDRAARWCLSVFGNRATFATPHDFPRRDPEVPLQISHVGFR